MIAKAPKKTRTKRRAPPPVRLTLRGALGWAGLTGLVVGLVGLLVIGLSAGLPYYLTSPWLRPDHAVDLLFRPGGVYGLTYGVIGTVLMTSLLLYSVRKWLPFLGKVMGSSPFWMRFHLICGVLGPAFIVLHGAFLWPSGFIGVGFWCMCFVAVSGVFGRYLFGYFPAGAEGKRLDLKRANEALVALRESLVEATEGTASSAVGEAVALVRDFDAEAETMLGLVVLDADLRRRYDHIQILLRRAKLEPMALAEAERTMREALALRRAMAGFHVARRLMRFWSLMHQPLALAMYGIAGLHVLNAVLFGNVVPTLLGAL